MIGHPYHGFNLNLYQKQSKLLFLWKTLQIEQQTIVTQNKENDKTQNIS